MTGDDTDDWGEPYTSAWNCRRNRKRMSSPTAYKTMGVLRDHLACLLCSGFHFSNSCFYNAITVTFNELVVTFIKLA